MTDNEKLIEEAAKALDWNFNPDKHPIMAAMFRDYAATCLAVFERANTPTVHEGTTDEREALARAVLEAAVHPLIPQRDPAGTERDFADRLIASRSWPFRRTEVPEPSAEPDLMDRLKDSLRIKPQGKPSDLIQRLIDLRGDMRHNADEVATLDAAITACRGQDEPSDAQVLAAVDAFMASQMESEDGSGLVHKNMSAALRAANEVR